MHCLLPAPAILPESDAQPDQDVVELVRGERFRPAFERLLARYENKVMRLAWSFLPDRSQAEDAAQETFLKVWRALPKYDGRASFSTWIYAIARNVCRDRIRRGIRRPTVSLEEPAHGVAAESEAASRKDPSATMDVHRLLAELPAVQRQVLTLYYLEGQSYEDVARQMEMKLGTVKSHIHRAKRAMAERLGGPYPRGSS